MLKDITFGLRALRKNPGFAAVAIMTLALGIGFTAAIFSVVNAVLLRPLPYRDPDRLVVVWGNFLKLNIEHLQAKVAEFHDYADQTDVFEAVAAFDNQTLNLTGAERPERVRSSHVTGNLFTLLGVMPERGRSFGPGENEPGKDNVVILNHGFWQTRFGGDDRIINRTITLDDRTYIVIGVLPPNFQFPHPNFPWAEPAEVFLPLAYSPEQVTERRGPYFLNVLARLRSGITLEQAQLAMAAVARHLEKEKRGYRGPNGEDGGWRITLLPLQQQIVGSTRPALLLLFGAVTLVLFIACANVANLLLLRGARRRKELAIRCALGAGSLRIFRQVLIEALLLTVMASGVALLLARWAIDFLIVFGPSTLFRAAEIRIDGRVLIFTMTLAIITGIVFGLTPALQVTRLDLQTSLKGVESKISSRFSRQYWSSILVIGEIALSIVLLVSAGLLVNSFLRLQRVNSGLAIDHLVTAEINLSASRYREPDRAQTFYDELARQIDSLPGVQSATYSTVQPLSGVAHNDPFAIEGRPLDPANPMSAGWQMVGSDYFRTLGINIVRGRDLTAADTLQPAPVAVINERMANRYWPNEDPLGHRISLGLPGPDNPWVTIVGIARDIPHRTIDSKAEPDWYLSRAPGLRLNRFLFVRTYGEPNALAEQIATVVSTLDRDQPLSNVSSMNEVVNRTVAPRKFNAWLLGVFAVVAITLAALGIFSVISYAVTMRTQEIGIRMALGARTVNVLALVLKQGMMLAVIGIVVGVTGSLLLTRVMKSLLFGISATDPLTFVLVAVTAMFVALMASYLPARAAIRVDPLKTLKSE